MEHIVQFGISIDDERIKQVVAEKAEKEIIAQLKNDIGRVIFEKSYYGKYNENRLSDWSTRQFINFLDTHKTEIINAAAKELANRLARSKAGKAILEDLQ